MTLTESLVPYFFHCLMTPTVQFTPDTPLQELYWIVDWRFHQAAAVLSYVLFFDVQKLQPPNSPQNLCVAGGIRAISRSNNCLCCPFPQSKLSGP